MPTKKFEYCYVHIGLEKTGTTTIQETLQINRPQLEAQSVYTPHAFWTPNNKLLAAYGMDWDSEDVAVRSAGTFSDANEFEKFRALLSESFVKEIAGRSESRLVISTEDLHRIRKAEHVERIIQLLSQVAEAVKIIVFLRRQDLLAVSRFTMLLRFGSCDGTVFPFNKDGTLDSFYDFNSIISMWESVVGRNNIIPVIYPEKRSTAFDAVTTFLDVLAIDQSSFARTVDTNISLDSANLRVLLRFNNYLKSIASESERDSLRRRVIDSLIEFNNKGPLLFRQSRASQFLALYQDGNAAIAERYFGGNSIFSEDFSMYIEEGNLDSTLQDEILNRFCKLIHIHAHQQ